LRSPKIFPEEALKKDEIGIVTGLAWTAVGGDILFIEALKTKGKGKLTLTGQLGEVMQESAQAAFSFAKARASELGIDEDAFEKYDIHVHLPEGAIPKDGPSAGITMATAIVSVLSQRAVRKDVAMTGRNYLKRQRPARRRSQRKTACGAACKDKNGNFACAEQARPGGLISGSSGRFDIYIRGKCP
jgi:ATP-dependent Lon protease